jgi:hypothetical protein
VFWGSIARQQRKVPRGRDDEEALTADIIALRGQYGRYGYRPDHGDSFGRLAGR